MRRASGRPIKHERLTLRTGQPGARTVPVTNRAQSSEVPRGGPDVRSTGSRKRLDSSVAQLHQIEFRAGVWSRTRGLALTLGLSPR